jgi:hypothetical protein
MTQTLGWPGDPRSRADGVEMMAMLHDVNLLARSLTFHAPWGRFLGASR